MNKFLEFVKYKYWWLVMYEKKLIWIFKYLNEKLKYFFLYEFCVNCYVKEIVILRWLNNWDNIGSRVIFFGGGGGGVIIF